MTARYVSERIQFDRPIGSFQAVQHHVANMGMKLEAGRLVTYKALWQLTEGHPADRAVAIAKAWMSDAYVYITLLAQQLYGGAGFEAIADLPLWVRRAKATEGRYGDREYHLQRLARTMELGLL
jgi:alkylation response protein AidB-like acyl-CoA dehydrogenase